MSGKKVFLIILALVILSSFVMAEQVLTPEDKAYLDGLNQKTVAQLSAKIDSASSSAERNLREQVDGAREDLRVSITTEMKGALKGISIGLGGIIIVVLTIFKLVDLNMHHTKKIKKYEDELESKIKQADELFKVMKKEHEDNELLKRELTSYKIGLDKYALAIGVTPRIDMEKQPLTEVKEKKPFFTKRNVILLILFFVILLIAGFFVLKYLRVF